MDENDIDCGNYCIPADWAVFMDEPVCPITGISVVNSTELIDDG
jgi:hypothetical protein